LGFIGEGAQPFGSIAPRIEAKCADFIAAVVPQRRRPRRYMLG
jgi:hypothetical protein